MLGPQLSVLGRPGELSDFLGQDQERFVIGISDDRDNEPISGINGDSNMHVIFQIESAVSGLSEALKRGNFSKGLANAMT